MNITWLKTFVVAAEKENFRHASELLYLTQPTVTAHIKNLEKELEMPLFERVGRKVVLTEAGQRFYPVAKATLETYEKGIDELNSWRQGYIHKIKIAVAPFIASFMLPDFLNVFIKKNPDIEVVIDVVKSPDIGEEISSGKADIGLSRMRPMECNLDCREIFNDPVIFIAPQRETSESSAVADSVKAPPPEKQVLNEYTLFTHNHPEYWDELLTNIRLYYPNVKTLVVNQVEITKRFIEKGLGVSFLPKSIVQKEIESRRLSQVPTRQLTLPTSSIYLLHKFETSEIRVFIECLIDYLEPS